MTQIGWCEILIIVAVAIVIIGPKDFPIMLKKVGSWIGTAKRYISDVQKEVSNLEDENIDVNPETNNLKKKFEDKKDD